MGQIQADKESIRVGAGPQEPEKDSIYKPLLNHIITYYTQVLSYFEEAVVAFGGSCARPPSLKESEVNNAASKRSRSPVQEPEEGPNVIRRRASTRLARAPLV